MRDFRITVLSSLGGKVYEHGFFLQQINDVIQLIKLKYLTKNYPLNEEIEKLNYFFSAYLHTIQSLKDAMQIVTKESLSWSNLSPTYGNFIFYSRNAVTHDGTQLINGMKEGNTYIVGPLRRINNKGEIIEFDPPEEEVLSLCCNITKEILKSLRDVLEQERCSIPSLEEDDVKKTFQTAFNSKFIPQYAQELLEKNLTIKTPFEGVQINFVENILEAIASVEKIVHVRT